MDLLTEICSLPTAPFVEDRVIVYARRFAAHRNLRLSRDLEGNLRLELRSRSRLPRWVFAAHMDHPGMISRKMIDDTTLDADFRGYVFAEYLKNVPVRFFVNDAEIRGIIIEATPEKKSPCAMRVRVKVNQRVPP